MLMKTDCFILYREENQFLQTINVLRNSDVINQIYLISATEIEIDNAETIICTEPISVKTLTIIARKCNGDFALFALQNTEISLAQFALERLTQIAENTNAAMIYSDYYEIKNGVQNPHPVIDYQPGSLRDDFNFGPVQLFRTRYSGIERDPAAPYSLHYYPTHYDAGTDPNRHP
jgi:hypothetical protein